MTSCELYDYIVIGAGVAGITVALSLAKSGKQVLLVEEGSLIKPEKLPNNILDSMHKIWLGRQPISTLGSNPISIIAGSCVGGSSVISGMILHKIPEYTLSKIFHVFPNLSEYFSKKNIRKHEEDIHIDLGATQGISKEKIFFETYFKKNPEYTPMVRAINSCRNAGLCIVGCPNNQKNSFLNYLIKEKVDSLNLISDCRVEKILIKNKSAYGIIIKDSNGLNKSIHSRKGVLVTAGVLGSPNILKASGIANKNIGKFFSCNLGASGIAIYPDHRTKFEGDAMGLESFRVLKNGQKVKIAGQFTPKSIILSRLTDSHRVGTLSQSKNYSAWTSLLPSSSYGRIFRFPITGKPIVKFSISSVDKQNLIESLKMIRHECFKNGAIEFLSLLNGTPLDKVNVSEKINVGATHIFGGCIWGDQKENSVVNAKLQVHEHHNLYVCDASVFPEALGINPIIAISAFSRQLALNLINDEI